MYGPFFIERPTCILLSPLLAATLDDVAVGRRVLPGLVPLGGLAPRSAGVTTAGGAAFAAAQRMVDRVHDDAADRGANAEPAIAAGLAERDLFVVEVADLADGRHAIDEDKPDFAGGQPKVGVLPFLRQDLDDRTRGTGDLSAFANLELDVVDERADRDVPDREGIAR